jgi:acyl transferase domain-containing protein/NADPH:quinone reductase-like Zn-dependent oxidoreductase/acyl carrier protein
VSESTGLSPLKRAFLALEEMKARLEALENGAVPPIAVIGIGCRFPGDADTPDAFWQLLAEGRDAIRETPPDRWDVNALYDPDPNVPGKMYTKWGGFLSSVDRFDPQFFGIAPREAVSMDPQQRLLLEVSWEALEHAGQSTDRLINSPTGVFVGICTNDYATLQMKHGRADDIDAYQASGSAHSIASGRLSYVLGLQGPSVSIDTACSSSLVAIHLACQSLRTKECRMALAGGVHLSLSPENTIGFCKSRMLATDGHCKTFDASADGFSEGEGCGIVVLKQLTVAVADGDRILAVIRGSAVNQDGPSSGLTAPNGPSQEAVIRAALAMGKVAPDEISYVEAHGTGTSLGDPIELQALASVLRGGRSGAPPLLIGSVKTNVGHLEAAAGVAGLIKVVLALQHDTIPVHRNFRNPNPYVAWDELPLSVVTTPAPWPANARSRIAGVSAFGFSGTNAHVVLEQAPGSARRKPIARPLHPVTVSARGEEALGRQAARWLEFLRDRGDADLARVSRTANAGRAHLVDRAVMLPASMAELRESLGALARGEQPSGLLRGRVGSSDRPKIAFLFTGQGSQHALMGRELFESEPVFRRALQRCDELFKPHLPEPLLSVIYPEEAGGGLIDQTAYTQAALFSIEYALSELWKSWGIVPTAVLGHSLGEYVAAVVAGVLTLEDAARLVAVRGRLMQAQPAGGRMAAVSAGADQVADALAGHERYVAIAAVNGPENTVLSGSGTAFDAVIAKLAIAGARVEPLTVSHAFHSPMMDPLLDEFEAAAAAVSYGAPQIALISNLTGEVAGPEIAAPGYWRRHLREPVQFEKGIQTLLRRGLRLFVEIGPSPTLAAMAQRLVDDPAAKWLPSLRRGRGDWQQILQTLAALYVEGAPVDWQSFHRHDPAGCISLPTYPFNRARYWIDTSTPLAAERQAIRRDDLHPLLGRRLRSALEEIQFESSLSVEATPFLCDHRKRGAIIFPATGYLEMARAAAVSIFGRTDVSVNDVVILEPLALPERGGKTTQVVVAQSDAGSASFRLFSLDSEAGQPEQWKQHAIGALRVAAARADRPAAPSLDAVRARLADEVTAADYYEQMERDGHHYGPAFRGLSRIWRGESEVLAELELPEAIAGEVADYALHPAIFDAALQLIGAVSGAATADGKLYLPVSIDSAVVRVSGQTRGWSHTTLRPVSVGSAPTVDVRVFDAAGSIVAEVSGLRLQPVAAFAGHGRSDVERWLHEIVWREQPRDAAAQRTAGEPGIWMVMADASGAGTALAAELGRHGHTVVTVTAGERYEFARSRATVRASSPDDFQKLAEDLGSAGVVRGVVHLWSLDAVADATASADRLARAYRLSCGSLLHLVKVFTARTDGAKPRLWTITRGAQAVGGAPVACVQAPIWALASTIAAEHPAFLPVAIDVDPSDPVDVSALAREIVSPDREDRIALRGTVRYVARLAAVDGERRPARGPSAGPLVLDVPAPGMLDRLAWKPAQRRPPSAGEIEIQVAATGLNFRDVLTALGLYEGPPGAIGTDCVGTVVNVGDGTTAFRAGDQVMAFAGDTFRSFATVSAKAAVRRPASLSVEQAATIPAPFLTAFYALHRLARIARGERVLIHAAAGGVGLAAVQLAQRAGAEIFATAGSETKRDFLRAIGVAHVMSSRTLTFADEVMAATDGRGVDIVLNSLSGEFIDRSVATLAANGRFLEIGKKGIWTADQMRETRSDVAYHAIYLGELGADAIGEMLRELIARFEAGALAPLPFRVFARDQVVAAFRFMAQAKHLGKIVISHAPAGAVRAGASYLVTGGYGALGGHVARWLVDRGARHIVLMGRSRSSAAAEALVASLEATGAQVLAAEGDVVREEDVKRVLAEARAALPPLAGIVHAAGVVEDGTLVEQEWRSFERVMAPKMMGAWNLHACTVDQPLDFFVLFSSMVAMFGAPGQGSYAAANAFLDAFARYRSALGRPTVSINWGPWAGSGMAGGVAGQRHQRWSDQGVDFMAPERALEALELVLAAPAPQVGVLPVRWSQVFAGFGGKPVPPLLAELARGFSTTTAPRRAERRDLRAEVERTAPATRRAVVLAHLREQTAKVLSLDPSQPIDVREPLSELGLDSLMAVELRNAIGDLVGRSLPATLLFKYPTLTALTDHLLNDILGLAERTSEEPTPVVPDRDAAEVEPLADEEIKRLLAEELRALETNT